MAISVLVTNMAVLGKDNRVSLWQLGTPRHELELPSVECINIIQGPGDSVLLTGQTLIIMPSYSRLSLVL